MSGNNTTASGTQFAAIDFSIDKQAVIVGAVLGVLINMSAMLVPVLNYVGGGVIAGFVAAYMVGGPRGWLHGVIAGTFAGIAGGTVVMFTGALIGLYTEPPTLLQELFGIISPVFNGAGVLEPLYIGLGVAAFILVDSLIGSAIGGLLRTLVDVLFRR
ncbi:hypothetical protein [Halocatena pleomorpha]|uniref:DUF5518 domain-containing protein n=1 Tax=Halocatena pleomorpha TaxID=1785090 RepID=A0A3P3R9E0_9EURY|nr:hypothetical protein [Halocatena pleomorpha]RRJ29153.1 hypothetical protein EIK79_13520 [Halocatena pleomorpha]